MRKTAEVIIPADEKNRDAGRRYIITEMPAMQVEKFGLRALMALGSSNLAVPQDLADAGIIGVALIGYQAFMNADFKIVEPLMDEMLTKCVQVSPSENVVMPFNESL